MSRELPAIEVEAQLRLSMIENLQSLGYKFSPKGKRRYVPDEDIVLAVLKAYVIRKRPLDPMVLYRNALGGVYKLRKVAEEPKEPAQVVPAREPEALGSREPMTFSPFMRQAAEKARREQPKQVNMSSNVKASTLDGRHQGLA